MPSKKLKNHRQRLKERFFKGENLALNEETLLELMLTYSIPRKDVQPLAKALIKKFGDISGILNATFEELSNVSGIGQNSAILIKVIDAVQSHEASKPIHDVPKDQARTGHFQRSLFISEDQNKIDRKTPEPTKKAIKPFRKRGVELFANALMKETISVLPELPDTNSLDIARQHIKNNLHFNAESTRRRNSLYIVQRMFPEGYVDRPMRLFANLYKNRDELNEVCFYRFLIAEPLLGKIIDELIISSIGVGYLKRERIKDFLEKLFPELKSIKHGTKAILDALVFGGLAKLNGRKIVFSYRNIIFASFVFIFFSEFPNPGMHELDKIENNPTFAHMLWKPNQIIPMTYELRNKRFISKISEIDNIRQFTTKWNFEQAIERLISLDRTK